MSSLNELPASWRSVSLCDRLRALLNEEERGGFVLVNGLIIELTNIAEDKRTTFQASSEEVLEHCNKAIAAVWHTHPDGSANLTSEDWETFLAWPDIEHIIIAKDEIRFYGVKGRGVVNLPLPENA